MAQLTRREVLLTGSAAALAAASGISSAQTSRASARPSARNTHVFVASEAPDGILAYDWNVETGELAPAGVAASVPKVDWIEASHGGEFIYSASAVSSFEGQPAGEVASFRVRAGQREPKLDLLSARNSAGAGTCYVAIDRTGRMMLAADYGGGSAASFRIADGRLSPPVWRQHYTDHGPNTQRQQAAHAHSARFSPDNRFAYIVDLGGDRIHIYRCDPATAQMTPAGAYRAAPGSGPRMLHFHPNRRTAYCVNEMASTVDVLNWHSKDGSLTLVTRIDLLPAGYSGLTRGCDAVISSDGSFVYFANRDDNFLYAFRADPHTGAIAPMRRTSCGGKTPRSFTLDPSERWMLVANQDSNWISVFARNPATGELADKGKNFSARTPMRILFV